ncbi:nitrate reductase [Agaribacterium haliotis]|uniref:nitrate reductase n=1 Tax=Agaribacterium haliotis TaxID=2013869 RepID=UPI000BB55254|nr:nitrate reductase [Agaribacterium haliotis]
MSSLIAKSGTHHTTCPYCGVGCGVSAEVKDNVLVGVKGRTDHPANEGRLCVKGSALHETLDSDNRLLKPQIEGRETGWDEALDHIAERWKAIVDKHGPDSVAFYLSGQLLTEDYYVANKLLKGFVGTSNIDTNSRLCMASAVVAHKRAFGSDAVPASYEDLEQTDVLLMVGSNAAYAHPIVYQRIVKAKKERNFKVIVLDPRRTASCDIADIHLPLAPGSDAFFFNGLLSYLAANNKLDTDYIAKHCDGFEAALEAAQTQVPDLKSAAEVCELEQEQLAKVYELFADNERVITLFSQGINQSSSGVDKGNAIINCHLATGKIGKPGAAPFSITGQPNAMGGREVGGLANQFAAHMGFTPDAIERVEKFWNAANISKKEGLKAVDMFQAVNDGKIKAIWIMATNPVVSMPEANKVKEALEKCELVVVSDCMANTDTAATANVLLPATSWSEKHGTVTNSERCISLQKGFMQPAGMARHDWDIMCDFARRLGFGDAFNYQHQVEIFREHAELSGLDNNDTRAFNISALADISLDDYENFAPRRWPLTANKPEGTLRLFEDGQFFTPNKRAQFIPINARLPKLKAQTGQLVMNTGRIRDQWHTMTRTGKASRLLAHTEEPYVQVHPKDAELFNIKEGGLVELENQNSRYLGRALISDDQRRGEAFVPMHWNKVYASHGRADALVNAITDPICGQPEFKHSPVKTKAYPAAWQGYLLSSFEVTPKSDYWAKMTLDAGFNYAIADSRGVANWAEWLNELYPQIEDWISLEDSDGHFVRHAGFRGGVLSVALLIDKNKQALPNMQWLSSMLGKEISLQDRFTVLAGSPADDSQSPGAIICSCYQVGENQIRAAIAEGADSVEKLGALLKCGTNCGSCVPELGAIVDDELAALAVEAS